MEDQVAAKKKAIANAHYHLHQALADFSFECSGDSGAESMASSAFATALQLFDKCGLEGDALKDRIFAILQFWLKMNESLNEGKTINQFVDETIEENKLDNKALKA